MRLLIIILIKTVDKIKQTMQKTHMRYKNIRKYQGCLIGNNSGANKSSLKLAFDVGKLFTKLKITLVCGGRGGIMEAGCKGANEDGGLTVCILPGESFSDANGYCDVIIPSGIGYARNMVNVLSSDFVVAIGGGCGTLNEIAFAWQFNKNIYAFNTEEGWAKELSGRILDKKRITPVVCVSSIDELEKALKKDLFF
jgi:uncharacterized protein (TIGR00725 family)